MRSHRLAFRVRAGVTLVELLVAMPLGVGIGALALGLLLQTSRQARAIMAQSAALDRLEATTLILRSELAPLSGADLALQGDTLLEVRARLALLRVCTAAPAPWLEVGLPLSGDAPRAIDPLASLRAGDTLTLWYPADSAGRPPVAVHRRLLEAPLALRDGQCADTGAWSAAEPRWKLQLASDSMDRRVPLIGAPTEVHRRLRFRSYRSEGSWWLGRQAYTGGVWETIQPATGPLSAPGQGGVRWTVVRDPQGVPLAVDLRVRAPWEAAGLDALRPVRNDSSRTMLDLMAAWAPPPRP